MKTLKTFIIALCVTIQAYSQAPQGFNYQAIVRNSEGQVISNQEVGIKITLQDESGNLQYYSESHSQITNPQGLVTLVVGQGNPLSGAFPSIPWETGDIYLMVELDALGGDNYQYMGTSKLQSVPYALYAPSSGGSLSGSGEPGKVAFWTGETTLSSLTALSYDSNLEVISPPAAGDDDPIFEVKNRDGKVVFGVYQTGVRIYVDDE